MLFDFAVALLDIKAVTDPTFCFISYCPIFLYQFFVSGVSCDFDSGTCGFVQSKSDAFDWERTHGRTSTLGTGPIQDHTGQGNNIGKAVVFILRNAGIFQQITDQKLKI